MLPHGLVDEETRLNGRWWLRTLLCDRDMSPLISDSRPERRSSPPERFAAEAAAALPDADIRGPAPSFGQPQGCAVLKERFGGTAASRR